MEDIYQEIWTADQQGSGIQPVIHASHGDTSKGYVVVNEKSVADPDHALFGDVVIPDSKKGTYDLCKKLFNNYTLDQTKVEDETIEELGEVMEFLDAILDSGPMEIARDYIQVQTGRKFTDHKWYQLVSDLWFTTYKMGNNPSLTGFEHIVVGEQKKAKAGGYHFWYKYWLDDTAALSGKDDIVYNGTAGGMQDKNLLVPEISTISYTWNAFDYEREVNRKLFKKIGGFFNGCSAEGLLALGTVRGYFPARAPKETVINGSKYELKIFHGSSQRHLRTFYPVFLDIVEQIQQPEIPNTPIALPTPISSLPESTASYTIRIIGAKVNPKGDDVGKEMVTIVNTGADDEDITNWKIEDKNGNRYDLNNTKIASGEFQSYTLDKNSAQLSNKGGEIKLIDDNGDVVHEVFYTINQAREQGVTLLFDK
jgi:poly(U)-specific endoribonuclease